MENLNIRLKKMSLEKNLSKSYYKSAAKTILKSYNQSDPNFKYLFYDFIEGSKDSVEIDTIREVVSNLQRHIALRISIYKRNIEKSSEDHFDDDFDCYD